MPTKGLRERPMPIKSFRKAWLPSWEVPLALPLVAVAGVMIGTAVGRSAITSPPPADATYERAAPASPASVPERDSGDTAGNKRQLEGAAADAGARRRMSAALIIDEMAGHPFGFFK
jgi:hypothetical protein